jgi:hypothetical protein
VIRIARTLVVACTVVAAVVVVPAAAVPAATGPCFPDVSTPARGIRLELTKLVTPLRSRLAKDLVKVRPAPGTSNVHNGRFHGAPTQLIITRNADGSIDERFAIEPGGAPSGLTTIWTGHASLTPGTVSETDGQLLYDLDALNAIVPQRVKGSIALSFTDIHDPAEPKPGLEQLDTIDYVSTDVSPNDFGVSRSDEHHIGEPGLGGGYAADDTVVLDCPPNAAHAASTTHAAYRFFRGADGKVHGRTDTQATGGPIPTGDAYTSASCWGRSEARPLTVAEIDKEEDATGATIAGQTLPPTLPPSPCDPAFGPLPALTDNADDYVFAGLPTFPGEW